MADRMFDMAESTTRPTRLVIADDATGALEAGALLADAGWQTAVSFEPRLMPTEAMVAMWPGRHLDATAARESLEAWWRELNPPAGTRVYWKTDSTLRGPIGACFAALRLLRPDEVIVYCPAYPALGRTVRGGVLLVHGTPLAETEFSRDPLAPARRSRVVDVLKPQFSGEIAESQSDFELREHMRRGAGVIVCDAETEAAVEACHLVCRSWGGRALMAGPAGGVRYWLDRRVHTRPYWEVDGWRIVCGSRHPVSRQQAAEASALGYDVLCSPDRDAAAGTSEAAGLAARALQSAPEGLIVFGGDTTLAICRELNVNGLEPWGEVIPGVAASRAGRHVLITKAGGFGGPGLVETIVRKWKQR